MRRRKILPAMVLVLMVANVLGDETAETAETATGATCQRDKALRDMLVINEDNSHFFGSRNPENMTLSGLHAFVDQYAGSAVTHLFLCPNAMRASFRSRSRDAIWDTVDGKQPQGLWPQNEKRLHEAGLDPYEVWISRCRETGISPWLTIRMNDIHSVNEPDNFMHSSFWKAHSEYWRVPNGIQLPAEAGNGKDFRVDVGPKPKSGKVWAIAGLAKRDGVAEARFEAWLNGRALSAAEDVVNRQGFGGGTVRAIRFPCPLDAVKDGYNKLRIGQIGNSTAQQIVWVEIRVEP